MDDQPDSELARQLAPIINQWLEQQLKAAELRCAKCEAELKKLKDERNDDND